MIFCRVSRTTSKSINEKSIVNLTAWKSEIGFQSHKPILFYSRPKQLLHTTLESKVTYLWHKNFIAKITDLLTVFSEAILWRIGVSLAFGSHKFRLIFALIYEELKLTIDIMESLVAAGIIKKAKCQGNSQYSNVSWN